MSRERARGEVEVTIGPCRCTGSPHEQDTAWLPASLDPWDAAEAMAVVYSDDPPEVKQRKVSAIFLRRVRWGIEGDPASFDWATISPVMDKALTQYTGELMAPLALGPLGSSQDGQMDESISPTPESTDQNP